jgi:hypothetical protein
VRIGELEQHVGVARLIERAVTGEIPSPELALDIADGDHEAAGQQVLAVTTNRLLPTE